jgi:hypothetical protein
MPRFFPSLTSPSSSPLLSSLLLLWLCLDALVLISPFIPLLNQAGRYGKLVSGEDGRGEKKGHSSILLSPSLYLSTSFSFLSYYILASLLNGMLLVDCMQVYATGKEGNTPVLGMLRWIISVLFPSSPPPPSPSFFFSSHLFSLRILLFQMSLFQIHLVRRLYESMQTARFSEKSKQHGVVTMLGQKGI